MKRVGSIWPGVVAFGNLLKAAKRARKGKRDRSDVAGLFDALESNLIGIQRELVEKTYVPGEYRQFWIMDPKKRLISAAPFRDRVVQHALCQQIGPVLERKMIPDSYANRVGLGSSVALKRFTQFMRSSPYVLQCDVRKYFPSMDHEILMEQVRRSIKCADTLWLIETILAYGPEQEGLEWFPGDALFAPLERRKGLPIGNLLSQLLANVYLDGFDHFVKERLKVKKYLRYVDDLALFGDSREELEVALDGIQDFLAGLRLRLHEDKTRLISTSKGASFLGFQILPDRIRIRASNLRRVRQRFKVLQDGFAAGRIPFEFIHASAQSWIAHAKHGNTVRLRERIFEGLVFHGPWKWGRVPSGAPRRFLEQQSQELPFCLSEQEQPGQSEQQHRLSGRVGVPGASFPTPVPAKGIPLAVQGRSPARAPVVGMPSGRMVDLPEKSRDGRVAW